MVCMHIRMLLFILNWFSIGNPTEAFPILFKLEEMNMSAFTNI